MKFDDAVRAVQCHALAILTQPNSNIRLLAVGAKDHGPLGEASDFCITAYVPEKLTKKQLRDRNLLPFEQSVAAATGAKMPQGITLDVVESGSDFVPLQALSAPAALRGRHGGPTPAIDTQKFFDHLRCGIGITNPTGEYPRSLSVGTLGFFVRDGRHPERPPRAHGPVVRGQSATDAGQPDRRRSLGPGIGLRL